jgi:hypothetical protein
MKTIANPQVTTRYLFAYMQESVRKDVDICNLEYFKFFGIFLALRLECSLRINCEFIIACIIVRNMIMKNGRVYKCDSEFDFIDHLSI